MTRIQRARALRLGFLLGSLLVASGASAYPKSARERACDDRAWLHYAMAESVGVDADAAWEDTYEACMWAGTKFETTREQRAAEKPASKRHGAR